jgi:4-amino-4-deoxy-L-arabinose transferase-like glycosyltransferase
MVRPTRAKKLIYRGAAGQNTRERRTGPAGFPRWIAIPFILIVGLVLWIGVLSDSSGDLTVPDVDSILYVLAVLGVAVFLAYVDRKQNISGKVRKAGHNTVAR